MFLIHPRPVEYFCFVCLRYFPPHIYPSDPRNKFVIIETLNWCNLTQRCTSGLCGGVHSSVVRTIRTQLAESGENTKVVCVGDKSRAILQRLFAKNIIMVATEVGRLSPTFLDAAKLAQAILNSGYQFTSGEIVFNRFRTVVSYKTQQLPIYSLAAVQVSDVEIVDLRWREMLGNVFGFTGCW